MTQATFVPQPGAGPAAQPAGAEPPPADMASLPIEYATMRWQVCDPDFKIMIGTPPCQDIPQARLFCDQASAWMKEGMGTLWALVLAHMVWRANTRLDHPVSIASIADKLGRARSWVITIKDGLCRCRIIQQVPGGLGRPCTFRFAKHEHVLQLIRQHRNTWNRNKSDGGAA